MVPHRSLSPHQMREILLAVEDEEGHDRAVVLSVHKMRAATAALVDLIGGDQAEKVIRSIQRELCRH